MLEETLRKFNPWWNADFKTPGILRSSYLDEIKRLMARENVVILFGLRRVGKTTIMKQMVADLLQNMEPKTILFASLDHTEIERTSILDLLRYFRSHNKLKSSELTYLFLDEVQSRPDFEKEIKSIYDTEERVKIIVSGSSSLVIKHKGAGLVGRYRSVKVEPLDFGEFLAFRGEKSDVSEPDLLRGLAEEYLLTGGIPEYVLGSDPGYLLDLVDNVIFRDISRTYHVEDPKLMKDLFFLLMCRVGKRVSYSKLARLLNMGDDAIKRYMGYFEEAFLISLIEQDGTPNERKYGPKKCYAPDLGICSVISGLSDLGPLAENAVFLKLRKRGEVRYVERDGKEVDFLIGNRAIEVKYKDSVSSSDLECLQSFKKRGISNKVIITRSPTTSPHIVHTTMSDFLLS